MKQLIKGLLLVV